MTDRPAISFDDLAALPYLYLTTTGRKSGLPREIEIWFVTFGDRFYILAEHGLATHWVKNIQVNSVVRVRLGDYEFGATARVLDSSRDGDAWRTAQTLMHAKYGWGAGLPVEITP